MDNLRVFSNDEIAELTKNFSSERKIGEPGAYGQVYKGRIRSKRIVDYPDCPWKLAIKVCKVHNSYSRRMWENEVKALGSISHKNVIRLVGYAETETYDALVYERARNDLQNYKPSNQAELDEILVGLASGLAAVHSAGFIHWDFQLRNLLLMKDGTVKIADFGLATKRGEPMTFWNDKRVGVFNPDDTEAVQEKFDVYCFGFVLRSLVLRTKTRYSPSQTPRRKLSEDCCLAESPVKRPSMDEVVRKLKIIQLEALPKEE